MSRYSGYNYYRVTSNSKKESLTQDNTVYVITSGNTSLSNTISIVFEDNPVSSVEIAPYIQMYGISAPDVVRHSRLVLTVGSDEYLDGAGNFIVLFSKFVDLMDYNLTSYGHLDFKDQEAANKASIMSKYLHGLRHLESKLEACKGDVKDVSEKIESHKGIWRLLNDAADQGYEIIHSPDIGIKINFDNVTASDVKGNKPDIYLGTVSVAVLPTHNRILFLRHVDSLPKRTRYCVEAVHPHQMGDNFGCLGTLEIDLAEAIKKASLPIIKALTYNFVHSYNSDDSAGEGHYLWLEDYDSYDVPDGYVVLHNGDVVDEDRAYNIDGEWYDDSEVVYSNYFDNHYLSEDVVWSDYLSDYIPEDEAITLWDGTLVVHDMDDVVKCESDGQYYFMHNTIFDEDSEQYYPERTHFLLEYDLKIYSLEDSIRDTSGRIHYKGHEGETFIMYENVAYDIKDCIEHKDELVPFSALVPEGGTGELILTRGAAVYNGEYYRPEKLLEIVAESNKE